MSRARRMLVPLLVLLLLQVGLPQVVGHGGNGDGHQDTTQAQPVSGGFGPAAEPLTPEARYVEQRNPHAFGGMVVWQQRDVGRDWDIMAYNLTAGGPAFPVTLDAVNQVNPVVRGPWIAWEEHTDASIDIALLNLKTGETFRVPDSGEDEANPTLGDRAVYFFMPRNKGTGFLRGYDLVDHKMIYPARNVSVLGPPSAFGPLVAWAEGNNLEGKIRVLDTRTGEMDEVPDLWTLREGPILGPWGVAYIADVTRAQRGVYTMLYDLEEGTFEPMRTGWYPHKHLGQCGAGVTWDQFRELESGRELPVVALWDGFTGKVIDFGYNNFDATCTGDWFVYEKLVPAEDPDLPDTGRLYFFDLGRTRPPAQSFIKIADGLERGIFQGTVVMRGTVILGDPREPLQGLWAAVDNGQLQAAEARRINDQMYEWRFQLDTTRLFSGQHVLTIMTVDTQGTESRRGFTFFTDSPYTTDPAIFDQPLRVPLEEPSPFPFNLLDHYNDYRQFYNTVFLVLGSIAVFAFIAWRWWKSRPRGKPEYVRDESAYRYDEEAYDEAYEAAYGEPPDAERGEREPVRFQLN